VEEETHRERSKVLLVPTLQHFLVDELPILNRERKLDRLDADDMDLPFEDWEESGEKLTDVGLVGGRVEGERRDEEGRGEGFEVGDQGVDLYDGSK